MRKPSELDEANARHFLEMAKSNLAVLAERADRKEHTKELRRAYRYLHRIRQRIAERDAMGAISAALALTQTLTDLGIDLHSAALGPRKGGRNGAAVTNSKRAIANGPKASQIKTAVTKRMEAGEGRMKAYEATAREFGCVSRTIQRAMKH